MLLDYTVSLRNVLPTILDEASKSTCPPLHDYIISSQLFLACSDNLFMSSKTAGSNVSGINLS